MKDEYSQSADDLLKEVETPNSEDHMHGVQEMVEAFNHLISITLLSAHIQNNLHTDAEREEFKEGLVKTWKDTCESSIEAQIEAVVPKSMERTDQIMSMLEKVAANAGGTAKVAFESFKKEKGSEALFNVDKVKEVARMKMTTQLSTAAGLVRRLVGKL